MKRIFAPMILLLVISGCSSNRINYSKTLFRHIPDDPQLLALVRPNELMAFTQKTIGDMGILDVFDDRWGVGVQDIERYREIALEMFEALGLPWSDIEAVGVLIYFEKPIFLACGAIDKETVTQKILSLGFTQNDDSTINYVYEKQKLLLPEDGLMMMAEADLLDFLMSVPEENRLWHRDDFAEYRVKTPIDNTFFVWSDPPDHFLDGFAYRDDLGSISLAIDLKNSVTFRNSIRVKDPQKTVLLYDLIFGGVSIARGAFGTHEVYGPLFRGINVVQDSKQVTTSLVIPPDQVSTVRTQIINDLENPNSDDFKGIQRFFDTFR